MKVFLSPSNQPNNRCILGHSERDHCEELTFKMLPYLDAYGIEHKVHNRGDSMTKWVNEATRWGAQLYLPIHTNATAKGTARGTTFGFYPGRLESMEVGKIFKKHWMKLYPLKDRIRVGTYTFYEARAPKCPSVYIELFFHDNLADATWFHENMDKVAENLADAIADFFGAYKDKSVEQEKSIVDGHIVKFQIKNPENAEFFNKPIGTVIQLPIEEYLLGVVPAEIGNSHIEACKAQAIAARSLVYFWTQKGQVITDTTVHQAYRGALTKNPAFKNAFDAVKQTAGQVLLYNGTIAQTYYADSNGGKMVASKDHWVADLPYLVTKDDPWTVASGKPFKGHPVGMSQQGAIWAANNGANHVGILSFYYPGTEIHPTSSARPTEEKPIIVLYKAEAVTRNPLSLNIWATASKSRSLKLIPRGATVNVLEEVSSTWAFVEYEGVRGYVDRQYLKKLADKQDDTQGNTQEPKPNPVGVIYKAEVVTRNPLSLNIWSTITKGQSLKLVPRGALVDVLEEINASWAFVEYDKTRGYVGRQYLKMVGDSQDSTQDNTQDSPSEQKPEEKPSDVLYRSVVRTRFPLSLNLWRYANKVSSIRKIPNGATVDVLKEVTHIWAKVRYNGEVGYVDRQYLEKEGKPQQGVLYKATVKTLYPLSLNIWRDPRKGVSLTKVPRGAEVSVLQEVDATWAKVAYGKFVGYSDRKYLIKKG